MRSVPQHELTTIAGENKASEIARLMTGAATAASAAAARAWSSRQQPVRKLETQRHEADAGEPSFAQAIHTDILAGASVVAAAIRGYNAGFDWKDGGLRPAFQGCIYYILNRVVLLIVGRRQIRTLSTQVIA